MPPEWKNNIIYIFRTFCNNTENLTNRANGVTHNSGCCVVVVEIVRNYLGIGHRHTTIASNLNEHPVRADERSEHIIINIRMRYWCGVQPVRLYDGIIFKRIFPLTRGRGVEGRGNVPVAKRMTDGFRGYTILSKTK